MRRFYALGVLAATAVAAALGLKVTEARACNVPVCDLTDEALVIANCAADMCNNGNPNYLCGKCIPI